MKHWKLINQTILLLQSLPIVFDDELDILCVLEPFLLLLSRIQIVCDHRQILPQDVLMEHRLAV